MSTVVALDPRKFQDPDITAKGERRASVRMRRLETVWFNTGTVCNIECVNCYIESSPSNDRLVYLSAQEVAGFLDEIAARELPVREIGFTGGEPFTNPQFLEMLEEALGRGFEVLVLTNAMQPMMRRPVRERLLQLRQRHGPRLKMRVSVDHYTPQLHEQERGPGTWDKVMAGLQWLSRHGFAISVAGRTCWGESIEQARLGYARLFARDKLRINAADPAALVLFPEMDPTLDVPEITVDCWGILGVDPNSMMCASSRMVVKRKGAAAPVVLACTLLPYDSQFEMGPDLASSVHEVKLNHPHCARFCVLGGGSCSVKE